ncbi:dTDP-4-dehydrorhamnose 3,5-epimerase family protein [Methermicoccus shengliensis]|uniref:dTDP-4-dehydrorhamnose 3,5-epimerase family protein n=1 Tax=Methermicoccus shengliensis TaxID=660064 RepID=UPI0023F53D35
MLPGIVIKPLKRFADERGFFTEIMRKDWEDIFQDEIVQANLSITYPGIVRAWHKHERGQVDYFVCIKGAIKIAARFHRCGGGYGSSLQRPSGRARARKDDGDQL